LENHTLVAQQAFLRDPPAVEKQERRQEQQEEDLRIEPYFVVRERCDDRTEADLDQRRGNTQRQGADDDTAQHDGREHREDDAYRLHRAPACRDAVGLESRGDVAATFCGTAKRIFVEMRSIRPDKKIANADGRSGRGNIASARVSEKVGLVREAVLPCAIVRPNISTEPPRDAYLYAKVRE